MLRPTLFSLLAVAAVLVLPAAPPLCAAEARAGIRAVVEGNTAFACDVYLKRRDTTGNLILSPFSISSALAMTSAGARGKTLAEMQKTLHLPAQKTLHPGMRRLLEQMRRTSGVELHVANSLWGHKTTEFQPAFRRLVIDDYDATAKSLDFLKEAENARLQINRWTEERTDGQIKNLLPKGSIKPDTRLVLTNAISFKGQWVNHFPGDNTTIQPFHVSKGKTQKVWLMKQRASFRYHGQKDFQVLEMAYKGNDVSMLVLLPRKNETLAKVEKLLSPKILAQLIRNMTEQRVEVLLPRFKLTTQLSLAKQLQSMGMTKVFSNGADLSGMDGGKEKLALNDVVHKAFINVHEKGTEAGGATAAVVGSRSIEIVPVFRADRPFIFMVWDNRSGTILFMGRVVDPTAMN